ncbi:hypothetical protein FI667_g10014, partial [Globisporangium splendens]
MARVYIYLTSALLLLASTTSVEATLDPCTSNTKGKAPVPIPTGCTAQKTSRAIQAAECSHNTRVAGKQAFAVFTTSHQYDKNHGAPYGDCTAYTCTGTPKFAMQANADAWTFFWSSAGESSGVGTGCIRDPTNGVCGCENSDGKFISGGTNCK